MLYYKKVPTLIGIDYGTKRVGVAVSDETGSVAFPRATFPNDHSLIPTIAALVRQEKASVIVVGDTKGTNGEDNAVTASLHRFLAELQSAIAITVLLEPEFYTSQEARKTTGKRLVDAEAAAILLNSYIERKKITHPMSFISIDDFKKAEIKIGTVRSAERVLETDKLLRLEVDFGEESPRQILSGIAEHVEPSVLVGRQFPFITNLEPRVIRGLVSNGMLLAVGEGETFALLSPTRPVSEGSRIR